LLLHLRRMVSLASLDFAEMGRCLLGAGAAGGAAWLTAWLLRLAFPHLNAVTWLHRARLTDAVILLAGALVWAVIAKWVLDKTGSALPRVALRRLGLG